MKKVSNVVFNILCLIMLIGITVFLIIKWDSIPSVVASHYDFAGNVDSFGKKSSILMSPIMAWILYIVITVVSFFPGAWNTGVKVTEDNKERVYGVLLNMMNIIKTIIVFVFCYLTVCMALEYRLPAWLTIVEIGLIFGTIIISIVKLYKVR